VLCGGWIAIANDFVFWNEALDVMESLQVTGFAGIPSTFSMLLNRSDFLKRSWPRLRYLTCAGGALPIAFAQRMQESLPHVALYLMYGQTEASARLSCLPPADLARKQGSAGLPLQGTRIRIVAPDGRELAPTEIGEIVAESASVMQGYWNNPAATERALRGGALHTGDVGYLDAEGYLFIVGRQDDVIKSGGYRIGPQEIEDAILQVAGVAEAGVVGIPDATFGEVPIAFIVATGSDPSLVARVREHLHANLARYKRPHAIHVATSLPRTTNGKIARRRLRELLGDAAAGANKPQPGRDAS
jgi:long-chain acyl-CoA synthetase